MGLEKRIGKFVGSLLLAGSLSGCYVTGSDVWGAGLGVGASYIPNPIASRVVGKTGDLATLNAQRGHEIRRAEAGASNINIGYQDSQISDYNPLFDSEIRGDVSNDRKKIVFSKNMGENSEIFITDINGKNLQRLTFTPDNREYHPCWSPNDRKIAYFESYMPHLNSKYSFSNIRYLGNREDVMRSKKEIMEVRRWYGDLIRKAKEPVIGRVHIINVDGSEDIIYKIILWKDKSKFIPFFRVFEWQGEKFIQSNLKLSWKDENNLEFTIKHPSTKIDIELGE